jgi:hypothetical protein
MNQFEYKVMKFKPKSSFFGGSFDNDEINKKINILGQQGWELITSENIAEVFGSTKEILMTFKRSLNEN